MDQKMVVVVQSFSRGRPEGARPAGFSKAADAAIWMDGRGRNSGPKPLNLPGLGQFWPEQATQKYEFPHLYNALAGGLGPRGGLLKG